MAETPNALGPIGQDIPGWLGNLTTHQPPPSPDSRLHLHPPITHHHPHFPSPPHSARWQSIQPIVLNCAAHCLLSHCLVLTVPTRLFVLACCSPTTTIAPAAAHLKHLKQLLSIWSAHHRHRGGSTLRQLPFTAPNTTATSPIHRVARAESTPAPPVTIDKSPQPARACHGARAQPLRLVPRARRPPGPLSFTSHLHLHLFLPSHRVQSAQSRAPTSKTAPTTLNTPTLVLPTHSRQPRLATSSPPACSQLQPRRPRSARRSLKR